MADKFGVNLQKFIHAPNFLERGKVKLLIGPLCESKFSLISSEREASEYICQKLSREWKGGSSDTRETTTLDLTIRSLFLHFLFLEKMEIHILVLGF